MAIAPSRAEPRTLVPAARALYEAGKSRGEVLAAIYGVDLPREAALFQRDFVSDAKPLDVLWTTHPWELMIPLADGGPEFEIGRIETQREQWAYAQAPHVVVLGRIGYNDARFGSSLIGYDLDEVRAGRSTVVGLDHVPKMPESGAVFTVFGPSLVDVLCTTIAHYRELLEHRLERRLAGETVDEVHAITAQLESVAALRRELSP